MGTASNFIIAMGTGAVAFVLARGLINMLREGSPYLSQRLMRWRVSIQFAVIILLLAILWLRG
jgi:Hypoxia induced protein conserved region